MKTIKANDVIKSTCELCGSGCGVLIHLSRNKPIKVTGDPEHPANHGELCILGQASLEFLNHPNRLKYPLKRAGEKGEGKCQPVVPGQ